MRTRCTRSESGRQVRLHPKHDTIARHRALQRAREWKARYRAIRPKVERKIGHLMRRLAAAVNLARLAVLGVRSPARPMGGWGWDGGAPGGAQRRRAPIRLGGADGDRSAPVT
jgi:hypothetical protein